MDGVDGWVRGWMKYELAGWRGRGYRGGPWYHWNASVLRVKAAVYLDDGLTASARPFPPLPPWPGGKRTNWESSGGGRKTLNQLLTEMDGFEDNSGVVVVAATNLPETLDSALTRPGRFDRTVAVPLPDVAGREAILRLYLEGKPLAGDVDARLVARRTPGFSGAQLFILVKEGALLAARHDADAISGARGARGGGPGGPVLGRMASFWKAAVWRPAARDWCALHTLLSPTSPRRPLPSTNPPPVPRRRPPSASLLDEARDKILMGSPRALIQSEEARRLTAYHEGGHALVALLTPGAKPIHKATIVPR